MTHLTVGKLIIQLQAFPPDVMVHLDVSSDDESGWEGDRVVRHAVGTRIQDGFNAVAIDGSSVKDNSFKHETI